MNDFDAAARYALKHLDAEGLLRWLLGATLFAFWRWLGWLDTSTIAFPGEPKRTCDTVARFERLDGRAQAVALVIANLADRMDTWRSGLEEWNMERSTVVMEWEARGELRERRRVLLSYLRSRWAGAVPEELERAVEAQGDPDVLKRCLDQAFSGSSLEELRRTLQP